MAYDNNVTALRHLVIDVAAACMVLDGDLQRIEPQDMLASEMLPLIIELEKIRGFFEWFRRLAQAAEKSVKLVEPAQATVVAPAAEPGKQTAGNQFDQELASTAPVNPAPVSLPVTLAQGRLANVRLDLFAIPSALYQLDAVLCDLKGVGLQDFLAVDMQTKLREATASVRLAKEMAEGVRDAAYCTTGPKVPPLSLN